MLLVIVKKRPKRIIGLMREPKFIIWLLCDKGCFWNIMEYLKEMKVADYLLCSYTSQMSRNNIASWWLERIRKKENNNNKKITNKKAEKMWCICIMSKDVNGEYGYTSIWYLEIRAMIISNLKATIIDIHQASSRIT